MRLIDSDKALSWIETQNYGENAKVMLRGAFQIMPTVDAEPRARGWWFYDRDTGDEFCSMCGEQKPEGSDNYCPNCGAYMNRTKEEIDAELEEIERLKEEQI